MADAIIFAFNIENHYTHSSFKCYDDRQFANGHRTLTNSKLTASIVDKALKYNDIKLLKILLNGNDYFEKFIIGEFFERRYLVRCDAALSIFRLDSDGDIYICQAAFNNEELRIGHNGGLENTELEIIFNHRINHKDCEFCSMNYFCGGGNIVVTPLSLLKKGEFFTTSTNSILTPLKHKNGLL